MARGREAQAVGAAAGALIALRQHIALVALYHGLLTNDEQLDLEHFR